jgi:hypothetical protein
MIRGIIKNNSFCFSKTKLNNFFFKKDNKKKLIGWRIGVGLD